MNKLVTVLYNKRLWILTPILRYLANQLKKMIFLISIPSRAGGGGVFESRGFLAKSIFWMNSQQILTEGQEISEFILCIFELTIFNGVLLS